MNFAFQNVEFFFSAVYKMPGLIHCNTSKNHIEHVKIGHFWLKKLKKVHFLIYQNIFFGNKLLFIHQNEFSKIDFLFRKNQGYFPGAYTPFK